MTAVEPTFSTVPVGGESFGQDAVQLALGLGVGLDGWQQGIVRGALREDENGTLAASQVGVCVPRQNGKGNIILALELAFLLLTDGQVLHTAQNIKTSSDGFRRLMGIFLDNPDLERRIRRKSEATGAEFIELHSGARVTFSTRGANTGRGLSIDLLVIDEAMAFSATEAAALLPTVFARSDSLTVMLGTAPGAQHDAEAFTALRDAAHTATNPRLAWWEWCAPTDSNPDDEALWEIVNPAVASGRVPLQAVRNDKSSLPADVFAVERLGLWRPKVELQSTGVFTQAQWDACLDPDALPVRDLVLGVDVHRSNGGATIALAGRCKDGRVFVEQYDHLARASDVPSRVYDLLASKNGTLVAGLVIDSAGEAAVMDWATRQLRPSELRPSEVAGAAAALFDGIESQNLVHHGQKELATGIVNATPRPLRGGFAWDRKAGGSSSLIAASLAVYGVECLSAADHTMRRLVRNPRGGSGRAVPRGSSRRSNPRGGWQGLAE